MRDGHNPDKPRDGEFDASTRLYIRTNPADDGTEPLAPGLAFWASPDVVIVTPGGAVGGEAVPLQVNHVRVTVTNAGGIPAVDAYVDAFVNDPSVGISPATATFIGGDYVSVQAFSTATVDLPWTPGAADSGHRCLIARVSLLLPLDTYVNPAVFDVVGDRHVAQRNIQVLEVAQGKSMSFRFALGAGFGGAGSLKVRERTAELDARALAMMGGCGGGLPAARPLADLGVRVLSPRESAPRPSLVEDTRATLGAIRRPDPLSAGRAPEVRIEPAATAQVGSVTFAVAPDEERGRLHLVDVLHVDDASGTVLGGLTFVVRVV